MCRTRNAISKRKVRSEFCFELIVLYYKLISYGLLYIVNSEMFIRNSDHASINVCNVEIFALCFSLWYVELC